MYNDDYHHSIDSNPESCLVSIDVSWIIISRISELSWEHSTIFIKIPYNDNIHNINMILFHNIPEYCHSIFINIPYPFDSHVPNDFSRRASIGGLAAGCHRTAKRQTPRAMIFFSPEGDADPRAVGVLMVVCHD